MTLTRWGDERPEDGLSASPKSPQDPEPSRLSHGLVRRGAVAEGVEQWTIVRWHQAPSMDEPFRCGPLSKMTHVPELLGKSPPYGYPNRGSIGDLVLYDTQVDALAAIESGSFDGLDGFIPYASHTTEPLSSMRFRMSAGPHVIGEPRHAECHGSYHECTRLAGLETMTNPDREIKVEEVT